MKLRVLSVFLVILLVPCFAYARDESELNNSRATADVFVLGETLYGSGIDAYDDDYWKTTLEAGQEVKFDLRSTGSWVYGVSDFDLYLLNASGLTVDYSATYPSSTETREIIEYTVPSSGTYYLYVEPFYIASAARAYSITTTLMNPATATPTDTPTDTPTITPTHTPQDTPTAVESAVKNHWDLYE